MQSKIFQGQLETKQRSFVSKQGHRQPHIHSMARVLSPQLLNCLLLSVNDNTQMIDSLSMNKVRIQLFLLYLHLKKMARQLSHVSDRILVTLRFLF